MKHSNDYALNYPPLTRKGLSHLIKRWEGGEVVDTYYLTRELIKVFREVEAQNSIDAII